MIHTSKTEHKRVDDHG